VEDLAALHRPNVRGREGEHGDGFALGRHEFHVKDGIAPVAMNDCTNVTAPEAALWNVACENNGVEFAGHLLHPLAQPTSFVCVVEWEDVVYREV
jgi:hypothetical protein